MKYPASPLPILLAFCLIIIPILSPCQTNDNDTSYTQSQAQREKYFISTNLNHLAPDSIIIKPDTSLHQFHRSPLRELPNIPLGGAGQKYYPLTLQSNFFLPENTPNLTFLNFPFNQFELPFNENYHNIGRSYTRLVFITGTGGEQVVRVRHIQNIKKPITLFLEGQKLYSDGIYPNQLGDVGTGRGGVNFHHKRLKIQAGYEFFNLTLQENGGVMDSTDLALYVGTNVGSLPVNLASSFHLIKKKNGYANISYAILQSRNDSSRDSSSSWNLEIGLKGNLEGIRKVYTDQLSNTGFFANNYQDSLSSKDSMAFTQSQVSPYLRFNGNRFRAATFYRYSNSNIYLQFPENGLQNHIVGAEAAYNGSKWQLRASHEQNISGSNSSDFKSNAELSIPNLLKGTASVSALSALYHQPYTVSRYFSNHFIWDSSFQQSALQELSFKYLSDSLGLQLKSSFMLLTDPVFYNQAGLPQQFNGSHSLISVAITKHFRFRRMHFIPEVTWQNKSSELFRIPDLVIRTNLYLETYIFKNSLRVQPGVDFTYFTAFDAYDYSPALHVFKLQEGFTADVFPYLNPYVSLQVKTVRAFLMMENVLAGLTGYNYYIMPLYPAANRNLKVGLTWNFFN